MNMTLLFAIVSAYGGRRKLPLRRVALGNMSMSPGGEAGPLYIDGVLVGSASHRFAPW